jgi:hypothetical protein
MIAVMERFPMRRQQFLQMAMEEMIKFERQEAQLRLSERMDRARQLRIPMDLAVPQPGRLIRLARRARRPGLE